MLISLDVSAGLIHALPTFLPIEAARTAVQPEDSSNQGQARLGRDWASLSFLVLHPQQYQALGMR